MLITACGLVCFYLGTQVVKMTDECGDAQKTCRIAIDECDNAVGLLGVCMQQVTSLTDLVKSMATDGSRAFSGALHQCITTGLETARAAREAYEMCKFLKEAGAIQPPTL